MCRTCVMRDTYRGVQGGLPGSYLGEMGVLCNGRVMGDTLGLIFGVRPS